MGRYFPPSLPSGHQPDRPAETTSLQGFFILRMIDYDLLKSVINKTEYIKDSVFEMEFIDLLSRQENPPLVVDALFQKQSTYYIEVVCSKCQIYDVTEMSYLKILEYVSAAQKEDRINWVKIHTCRDCRSVSERRKRLDIKFNKNYKSYVDNLLMPGHDGIKPNDFTFNKILRIQNEFGDVFSEKIKFMKYYDFLKTPYWKTISRRVKAASSWTCRDCGAKSDLQTHHKSYDFHGKEHLFWETELVCLCKKCHSDIHEKINLHVEGHTH